MWKQLNHINSTLGFFSFIKSAIGVCCPDDVSEKILNMPQSGADEEPNPVWAGGDENEIDDATGTEAIITRPEDRGN